MKTFTLRIALFFSILVPAVFTYAQDVVPIDPPVSPVPIKPDLVYTLEPDYRRCVSPYCGGWWLTPVNRVYVAVPTEDDANSDIAPEPIYVASIDYSRLGLDKNEIRQFEYLIYTGQALIRGALVDYQWSKPNPGNERLKSLLASATWSAANTNQALGTYLDVKSSGIVCITTPCPYYEANQVNTYWRFQFHELNFDRARLTDEQLELARKLVADRSLMITGVRFVSQGMTGEGIGIAATRVYFPFPNR